MALLDFEEMERRRKERNAQLSGHSTGNTTGGLLDYNKLEKERRARIAQQQSQANNLQARVSKWLEDSKSYLDGYSARFAGRDGSRYVADAGSYLDAATKTKIALDAERDDILRTLSRQGALYDPEWASSVRSALIDSGELHSSVLADATKDRDYWAQFAVSPTQRNALLNDPESVYKNYMQFYSGQKNADAAGLQKWAEGAVSYNGDMAFDEMFTKPEIKEDPLRNLKLAAAEEMNAKLSLNNWKKNATGYSGISAEELLKQRMKDWESTQEQPGRLDSFIKLQQQQLEEREKKLGELFGQNAGQKERTPAIPELTPQIQRDLLAQRKSQDQQGSIPNTERETWFTQGAFSDGADWGDLWRAPLGTAIDVGSNFLGGMAEGAENLFDAAEGFQNWTTGPYDEKYRFLHGMPSSQEMIERDLIDGERSIKDAIRGSTGFDVDKNSVIGEKLEGLAQSGGQLTATALLQAGGVPWWLTTGMTSFGSSYEDALRQGATASEAGWSSLVSAGAEVLSEMISGGISFGGSTLDDMLTQKLATGISNKFIRKLAQTGLNVAGEGMEELLTEQLSALGRWLTYQTDEDLLDLLYSEEAMEAKLDAFIGGAVLGGFGSADVILGTAEERAERAQQRQRNLQAKEHYGQSQKELVAEALEIDPANAYAQKMQALLDKGKDLSGKQLGRLVEQNSNATAAEMMPALREAVANRLKSMGETGDVSVLTDALIKNFSGAKLTAAETSRIANSRNAASVAEDLAAANHPQAPTPGWLADSFDAIPVAGTPEIATSPAAPRNDNGENASPVAQTVGAEDVSAEQPRGLARTQKVTRAAQKAGKVATVADYAAAYGEHGAAMEQVYNMEGASQNAQQFASGYEVAYNWGYSGVRPEYLSRDDTRGYTGILTEAQRQRAYQNGLAAAKADNKTPINPNKFIGINRENWRPGKVSAVGTTAGGEALTVAHIDKAFGADVRGSVVNYLRTFAEITGVDVGLFESHEVDGKMVGPVIMDGGKRVDLRNSDGGFSWDNNKIYIDINAGARDGLTAKEVMKNTMFYTFGHEFTHFCEKWNAEEYLQFREFVFQYMDEKMAREYSAGSSQFRNVHELINARMDYEGADYDYSAREVVADALAKILPESQFIQELAKKKQNWAQKLMDAIKQFIADIKAALKGSDLTESAPHVDIRENIDGSLQYLEEIRQMYDKLAAGAVENYQAAMEAVVEADAEAVEAGEIITEGAVVTDGAQVSHSIKSMKHDIAEGQMFEDLKKVCGWTQAQVDTLRQQLKALVEYMTPHADILDLNETYGKEGRKYAPFKPNSDPLYKISLDFSTLCSKRLLTQHVIENLQLREGRPMSAEEQMAIRDMLIEYRKQEKGLQVACAMCYVEAARLKSPKQMQRWLDDPATQMRDYFAKQNKDFKKLVEEKQADFKESRGYARDASKKDMPNKDVTALNKIGPAMREQYQLTTQEQAIVDRAVALPDSTYFTAANLARLSESEPEIYAAYTTFIRNATRSKSLETDEPYYYGDSTRDNGNGIVVTDHLIESMNRENGLRFSSWSDWRIQHMLDYITAVIDCSVRGAAMHGYTKFGDEVRVLGKTGMMFNMSGVAGTQTGLNEDGTLSFSDTESINFEEAKQLRDEFPDTAGLQCIGVSDAHITALLHSDIIDYVIPYHVSGLNKALRRMADIYGWKDYTSTQHATVDKSAKFAEAVDQEHWHEEPAFSEFFVGYDTGMTGIEAMKASADNYIRMCQERGMTPKFEKFAQEENYWKLLIDRKMINQKTGSLIQQKAVQPNFNFDVIRGIVDKYVSNYDSGTEARALQHVVENWDSLPQRIKDLKKQGTTKTAKTQKALAAMDVVANEMLAAQGTETKVSGKKKRGETALEKDKPKKYNKHSRYSETETLFMSWENGSAPVGERKSFYRFGKIHFYEKTETGCIELSRAQFNERTDFNVENIDRRAERGVSKTLGLNGSSQRGQIDNSDRNRDTGAAEAVSRQAIGEKLRDDAGRGVSIGRGVAVESETETKISGKKRGTTLSDREVLEVAALRMDTSTLTEGEKTALDIFKNRLEEMRKLQIERERLGSLWHEQQFGSGDRSEAPKTLNRMQVLDGQIERAVNSVLSVEDKQILRDVLQKAREYVKEQSVDHYRGILERRKDRSTQAQLRQKLHSTVHELSQLLLHGDKNHHVPESMKKAVAGALDVINSLDARKTAAQITALDNRIMGLLQQKQAITQQMTDENSEALSKKLLSLEGEIQQLQKRKESAGRLQDKLAELSAAYAEIGKGADPDFVYAYDLTVADAIQGAVEKIGDTDLKDMSTEQLEALCNAYKMLRAAVRNSNRSFTQGKNATLDALIRSTINEVKNAGGVHDTLPAATAGVRKYLWDNLKPVYAMEKIGSNTFTDVFWSLIEGEGVYAGDVADASRFAERLEEKYGYKKWDFKKKYSFTSTAGTEFDLTLEQIMSLYAYAKRGDQALEHLRLGGFVFDSSIETYQEKDGKKSVLKHRVNIAKAHQLSAEIVGEIVAVLDDMPDVKSFVDEMQTYLSDTMGAKGNEVSMAMYDVALFKEKFYFPLKSAKQYMHEQNEVAGEVRIKNSGFTNKLTPGANNPVILNNFMDVWANHVHDMSMYHSFVLPIEDFNRIFNGKTRQAEGIEAVSVKATLQEAYGPEAVSYLRQLITDLNGGARSDPRESTGKALMSRFKKAAVMGSASVVIQQPSAMIRARALIDEKYFNHINPKLLSHNKLWEELKKYAPVAVIKEMGRFDMDTGRGTVDYIKNEKTIMDKVDDVLAVAPAKADEWAWIQIWEAVKRETAVKNPTMKTGSEEFLQKAGRRFTEVIVKTQVYDSTLSRSANMRSKSALMNMVTAFMAEPTTSINMLEQGIREWKRGNKKAAFRHFTAVYGSVLVNSLLVSIVYAMRDDDEDETFLEKYFSRATTELIDGINPLTYLPWIKDAWSILQGFDVERSDMSLVNDAGEALTTLVKTLSKDTEDMSEDELAENNKAVAEAWFGVADVVTNLLGVPVKNVRRDAMGMINTITTLKTDFTERGLANWEYLKDQLGEAAKDSLPVVGWLPDKSATDKLYDAIISGNDSYRARIEATFKRDTEAKTKTAIKNAVRKALKENDPRITQMAEAYLDGDFDTVMDLYEQIHSEGRFVHDTIKAAYKSRIGELEKKHGLEDEAEYTPDEDTADTLYDAEAYYEAVAGGDSDGAAFVKNDMLDYMDETDFNSKFRGTVKNHYEDGDLSGDEAEQMLTKHGGQSAQEAWEYVRYWDFKEEYPELELSKSAVNKYYDGYYKDGKQVCKGAESFDISLDVYAQYCERKAGYSKKEDIMKVIDELSLTVKQKDALYYLNGWAKSTIGDAPWH